ncbi:MAG: hypothetical protein HY391_04500 [Deltaproteobacteria bacterium]|nr:hypothetical protein [Deltaproteobacteria bacterium]
MSMLRAVASGTLMLTLLLAGSPLRADENDPFGMEPFSEQSHRVQSGPIRGSFTHKTVKKGIGWQYTCPAETRYRVSYAAIIDEPTLNINYLDRNAMDITLWIRDIPLEIEVYHRGKKTACQWFNVATLVAPKESKFTAYADSAYFHFILTPVTDADGAVNEVTKYDTLIKSNTSIYDFEWTNWIITKLPKWANSLLNDNLDYLINQKLRETLSSEAAWEISDRIGVELSKHIVSEE